MDCPTDQEVASFVAGTLEGGRQAAFREHLERCTSCQDLVGELFEGTSGQELEESGSGGRTTLRDLQVVSRGSRIDRFVVTEVLGAGAMGEVHAAIDPQLDREVAIKVLRPNPERGQARLLAEAKALARVSHPNVIAVYEVGTHAGRVFMAMEYVHGQSLSEWLRAEQRTWPSILEMFLQAGHGLAFAHAAGVIHRDFKPDNVMVGKDGRVRIVDFGLARSNESSGNAMVEALAGSGPSDVPLPVCITHEMTREGTLLGTPAYMPPEQLAGQRADARSDQFAFCVALYEALWGKRPFTGRDAASLYQAIMRGPTKPALRGVPAHVYDALEQGLRPKPEDRHASMGALLEGLTTRKQRVGRWPIGVAMGVALVAVAAVVPLRSRSTALALPAPSLSPSSSAVVVPEPKLLPTATAAAGELLAQPAPTASAAVDPITASSASTSTRSRPQQHSRAHAVRPTPTGSRGLFDDIR